MRFFILAVFLLILGSIYTVSRKLQSLQFVFDADSKQYEQFKQPIFQTFCLFFGQFLCLGVKRLKNSYYKLTNKPKAKLIKGKIWKPYLFAFFPAFFDVLATIVDTIGLFYTHVSISQMLKAFLIVFTYLISKLCLGKSISKNQGLGIVFVFAGVSLIGYSNIYESSVVGKQNKIYGFFFQEASNPILGNILCITAQAFIALMFITEETIMKDQHLGALSLVGWEGLWGMLTCCVILGIISILGDFQTYFHEDFYKTSHQVLSNQNLLLALCLSIFSIGPFNYFGSQITKMSSALHRSALDSLRMLCVWCLSLTNQWEQFRYLQLFGFTVLTSGVLLIGVIQIIYIIKQYYKKEQEKEEQQDSIQKIEKKDYQIVDDDCDDKITI